jgi:hypothetical protein
MFSSYSDDSTVVSHRRDAGEQRGSAVRRPGINYFRRIRCVTVGTAQITPRYQDLAVYMQPAKKPRFDEAFCVSGRVREKGNLLRDAQHAIVMS